MLNLNNCFILNIQKSRGLPSSHDFDNSAHLRIACFIGSLEPKKVRQNTSQIMVRGTTIRIQIENIK